MKRISVFVDIGVEKPSYKLTHSSGDVSGIHRYII